MMLATHPLLFTSYTRDTKRRLPDPPIDSKHLQPTIGVNEGIFPVPSNVELAARHDIEPSSLADAPANPINHHLQ